MEISRRQLDLKRQKIKTDVRVLELQIYESYETRIEAMTMDDIFHEQRAERRGPKTEA